MNTILSYALTFTLGIAIGLALASAWLAWGTLPMLGSGAPTSTSTESSLRASGAVSVADQPSGNTIVVESVTVAPPGVWVAVEEMNNGMLGNVLGAARVHGPASTVSIELLRPTLPSHEYAVVLYRDDANGAFDLASDSVYVDFDTGARVVAPFRTTL